MMSRRDELLKYLCKTDEDRLTREELIDKLLFLEGQLAALEKLPFIKVHPSNPELQKPTAAAKQYKEFLQQYTNIVKVLTYGNKDDKAGEESPLRKWVKNHVD